MLKKAGLEGRDVVFLFNDTQILHEGFLEDLNNILNAGEVPDLLGVDDLEEIGNCLRPIMAASGIQPITKMSIYSYFVSRYVQRLEVSQLLWLSERQLCSLVVQLTCCTGLLHHAAFAMAWAPARLGSFENKHLSTVCAHL